jgi:hypothetical protein
VQFAQRSWLVREELEALLTENNVEIAGRKWHVERTPLRPTNRGAIAPGVQVETRDLSRCYFRCGQASHDPRAASNVQYELARSKLRATNEIFRPFRGDRGHEVALEKLRRAAFQLPLAFAHRASRFGIRSTIRRTEPVSQMDHDRQKLSANPTTTFDQFIGSRPPLRSMRARWER